MNCNALVVRYGAEVAWYAPQLRTAIGSLALLDESIPITTADGGSAVFGAAIFDMEVCEQEGNRSLRPEVRRLAGLSMKYFNVLDDTIDDATLNLNGPQKSRLIHDLVDQAWQGSSTTSTIPNTSFARAAIGMGRYLNTSVQNTPNVIYLKSIQSARDSEAAHSLQHTPGALLESVTNLGRPCGTIMAGCVEVVAGSCSEAVQRAAENLGIYGMIIDHTYEINADLQAASTSVATEMIKIHGDSKRTRHMIRELCLDHAETFRKAGMTDLTSRQRDIYRSIVKLFNIRYKFVTRMSDAVLGVRAQRPKDLATIPVV